MNVIDKTMQKSKQGNLWIEVGRAEHQFGSLSCMNVITYFCLFICLGIKVKEEQYKYTNKFTVKMKNHMDTQKNPA